MPAFTYVDGAGRARCDSFPVGQVLYHIPPLRKFILSHLCEEEFCVACEIAFLFHMLDMTKGTRLGKCDSVHRAAHDLRRQL